MHKLPSWSLAARNVEYRVAGLLDVRGGTDGGGWDFPGVVSALQDGCLDWIDGYRLAKRYPETGQVLAQTAVTGEMSSPFQHEGDPSR